jgi:hypothetical protein
MCELAGLLATDEPGLLATEEAGLLTTDEGGLLTTEDGGLEATELPGLENTDEGGELTIDDEDRIELQEQSTHVGGFAEHGTPLPGLTPLMVLPANNPRVGGGGTGTPLGPQALLNRLQTLPVQTHSACPQLAECEEDDGGLKDETLDTLELDTEEDDTDDGDEQQELMLLKV